MQVAGLTQEQIQARKDAEAYCVKAGIKFKRIPMKVEKQCLRLVDKISSAYRAWLEEDDIEWNQHFASFRHGYLLAIGKDRNYDGEDAKILEEFQSAYKRKTEDELFDEYSRLWDEFRAACIDVSTNSVDAYQFREVMAITGGFTTTTSSLPK